MHLCKKTTRFADFKVHKQKRVQQTHTYLYYVYLKLISIQVILKFAIKIETLKKVHLNQQLRTRKDIIE